MDELNLTVAAVGFLVIGIGAFSKAIRAAFVSGALIAFGVGIVLGPVLLNLLHVARWGLSESGILEEAARFTLAIGLVGNALTLPPGDLVNRKGALVVLIGLLMPLMWLAGGALVYLVLGVPIAVALLIGAILAPTDPILARSVVMGDLAGKFVPEKIRNLLIGESGLNDGLAYPFVFLMIAVLTRSMPEAITHWVLYDMLLGVGGATVIGYAAGYGIGRLLLWSEERELIYKNYAFAFPIALAIFVLALAKLLQTDDILAVFVAGIAFSHQLSQSERFEEEEIQNSIDHFFSIPIFFLFGLMIPWREWVGLGWGALGLIIAVLLLRRLPFLLLLTPLLKDQISNRKEALFYGWFGPIGVSAVFYAMLALHDIRLNGVWVISSLVVAASIVAFGITASPFVKRLHGE